MDNVQLCKLIFRQRKDLIFWVVLLFNTLSTFVAPSLDWYIPMKLILLFWVGSGVWLVLPVIERLKKRRKAWQLATVALIIGSLYLFPEAWPQKVEYPLLELWFLVTIPFTWLSVWRYYGWQKMCRPRGLLWTLWPILLTAGALWAVLDVDRGALWASFLEQLFYLALGLEYCRNGAYYRHRVIFTGGLTLVSLGFWSMFLAYGWVLPEASYVGVWFFGVAALEVCLPLFSRQ